MKCKCSYRGPKDLVFAFSLVTREAPRVRARIRFKVRVSFGVRIRVRVRIRQGD